MSTSSISTARQQLSATENRVQPLDVFTLPLYGSRLIEASAGTGKTYTLALLYLRLLLGLGKERAFERPLTVREILVVTFTKAATQELRDRIRQNIHDLRIACLRGETKHSGLQALLQQINERSYAAQQLLIAERQMDDAAIYTIHGFCQRILNQHAFESGTLFQSILIQDEQLIQRQAVADFWRYHCYNIPLSLANVIQQTWADPEHLLTEIRPYLQGDLPEFNGENLDMAAIEIRHQQQLTQIASIKVQWQQQRSTLEKIINQSDVNKKSYSQRYLPLWLEKVDRWALSPTEDYRIVDELAHFRQSILQSKTKTGGKPPTHSLFQAIDDFYQQLHDIKQLMLPLALISVRQLIQQEKRKLNQVGLNDLLSRLDQALHYSPNHQLAHAIRQRYPVAMIDEFQDTDPQQYRIFNQIYSAKLHQPSSYGLILIGDPKQAIYAFRGADIFTYMKARCEVDAHYTMTTNWRSAPMMVEAINQLFTQHTPAFKFKDIPFLSMAAADKNRAYAFCLHNKEQPALCFQWLPTAGVNKESYLQIMAKQCALEINDWLVAAQNGDAYLRYDEQTIRPVNANDIAILVRHRQEARLMQQALNALSISSVYLSNRDSVFNTMEARELLWLMQAVLAPEQEHLIRTVLACHLFHLDILEIDRINQDEHLWEAIVLEFSEYQRCWQQQGILSMLQQVMQRHCIAENLLKCQRGERRLTDILHLGELLQEASLQLESEHALIRWLTQQIIKPNHQSEEQQLRLESEEHVIKIITIHKSKGLEYPLVWLPFVCHFRREKRAFYHDRQHFTAKLDLQKKSENITLADEERLAEDLRLLYVALTRTIFHCSIGMAPLISNHRAKEGNSDLHLSAIGYLLQQGLPITAQQLAARLAAFYPPGAELKVISERKATPWPKQTFATPLLQSRQFSGEIDEHWHMTSYSALHQHQIKKRPLLLRSQFDHEVLGEQSPPSDEFNRYNFPRGVNAGTFLHGLLESIDFSQPIPYHILAHQCEKFNLAESWLPVLAEWLTTICHTPLNEAGLTLAAITPEHKQAEWQFYLPIEPLLQSANLNHLLTQYDPISVQCPPLNFAQVRGMLRGFIDLIIQWQGNYYIIDFKSNYLGPAGEYYHHKAITQTMIQHRYDLQYQLYTLALHRYLKKRMPNYDYHHHFGGVFYLFLRGMDQNKPDQGIYHYKPTAEFIDKLDHLFVDQIGVASC